MSHLDWIILAVTLIGTITYGLYKSRTTHNLDGYLLANRSLPWGLVLLSIMGTQASAITFLSAPGQAYTDGMRFVQYYFGLPLAMVVICIFFVPIFSKLKVYTAYEFLENRFDGKTRTLTSFLFLLQRGVSTGISVFAPSIILSSLFGWNIYWTNLFMGGLADHLHVEWWCKSCGLHTAASIDHYFFQECFLPDIWSYICCLKMLALLMHCM